MKKKPKLSDLYPKSMLPRRVQAKGNWFYLVRAAGEKRIWSRLSPIRDGLPALYAALAKALKDAATADDAMPKLIVDWERDVASKHAPKTLRDEKARGKIIGEAFLHLRASEVTPPIVADFLRLIEHKPKTHNMYRTQLSALMSYAMLRGFRPPGSNPVTGIIKTMPTPPRTRSISDSELRRIKVAAMRGDDGRLTRSGPMICALIDMALLTGQRIGDLLALTWGQFEADGIRFKTGKTGALVMVTWTPQLRDVERRLKLLRLSRPGRSAQVFTTQTGEPYTYWGASTAWRRALKRAGIADCHLHDVRSKAMTQVDDERGIGEARRMGGHTTEAQTATYIRHRTARKVGATR